MKKNKKVNIGLLLTGIITFIYSILGFSHYNTICFADDSELEAEKATVCLDSGHDYKHTGAQGFGLREEEINFKITGYCKDYLEANSNINVVLTHDTLECPYPDTPYEDCNYERVVQARNDNADLYVSIHVNAESTGTSSGVHFIYPQTNWMDKYNVLGLQFLDSLKNSGIQEIMPITKYYTRDSTDDEENSTNFYPDESRADYYGVIRYSKYMGFLGVIIEHGFITTKEDNDYLTNEDILKALGEADAVSIIDYFNKQGFNTEKEKPVSEASASNDTPIRSLDHLKKIIINPVMDRYSLLLIKITPAKDNTYFSMENAVKDKIVR
jgi:N-acetylmuramoyl-L-alanine amidase